MAVASGAALAISGAGRGGRLLVQHEADARRRQRKDGRALGQAGEELVRPRIARPVEDDRIKSRRARQPVPGAPRTPRSNGPGGSDVETGAFMRRPRPRSAGHRDRPPPPCRRGCRARRCGRRSSTMISSQSRIVLRRWAISTQVMPRRRTALRILSSLSASSALVASSSTSTAGSLHQGAGDLEALALAAVEVAPAFLDDAVDVARRCFTTSLRPASCTAASRVRWVTVSSHSVMLSRTVPWNRQMSWSTDETMWASAVAAPFGERMAVDADRRRCAACRGR